MESMHSTFHTSRFLAGSKDPLGKFKEQQKLMFKRLYDQIHEQPFTAPVEQHEETILLSQAASLKSLLNSEIRLEQGSEWGLRRKKRIFEPLSLVQLPTHGKCVEGLGASRSQNNQEVQTSMVSQMQQPQASRFHQTGQSLIFEVREEAVAEVKELNYDWSRWQTHDNWKPNLSETRFRLAEEDYKYEYCEHCNNIVREENQELHLLCCGQHATREHQEMLKKFEYLIFQEVQKLRDFNTKCSQTRLYSFSGLEIVRLLGEKMSEKRRKKLRGDLLEINRYIQQLKNEYNGQVCQLFAHLVKRL